MGIDQRELEFKDAVSGQVPGSLHVSPCYGTSNIARMIPGGIVLCISNLDNLSGSVNSVAFLSRLCPLPNMEIYLGGVVTSDLSSLRSRLSEMLYLCSSGDNRYGERNNNVSVCLGKGSKLYIYNKKVTELCEPPQDFLGNGIIIDRLYYSVYRYNQTASDNSAVSELLKSLSFFLGNSKFEELAIWCQFEVKRQAAPIKYPSRICLPKPFLLLAGISGTGKTRFVREQANASAASYGFEKEFNYCLVPVRPDWHEPSDLLGYISRIGNDGPRYVATDLLRFIVKAWKHAAQSATAEKIEYKPIASICPFWLCLDEMNLAPVEQYFADYLSILETRKWEEGVYSCDPLLKSALIDQLEEKGEAALWSDLDVDGENPLESGLREYFVSTGIPLPPNLIVAGTVNMDETTHGFSRKVIDRALTLDFGEFYPNKYIDFFEPKDRPKILGLPTLTQIAKSDLAAVAADPDGTKTMSFLDGVNAELKGTPFELAYRALNEALLAVVCFNPNDDRALQAVWDDYLMMKVLPRIEGDAEKLGFDGEQTGLLNDLSTALKVLLPVVSDTERPDLFREKAADGGEVTTGCRSLNKLGQMQKRLEKNSFTSFWP